jgi:hypothetical protein
MLYLREVDVDEFGPGEALRVDVISLTTHDRKTRYEILSLPFKTTDSPSVLQEV